MRAQLRGRAVSFGWGEADPGVFASEREIIWRGTKGEERFALDRARLLGVHNVENLMAAVAVAQEIGVGHATIQRVINEFPGLEHRLEFVRERNGVRFYNDSKGTNVGALLKSLKSFSAPVILLAGGVDKGGDYRPLEEEVRCKVKKLILFGVAKKIIMRRGAGRLKPLFRTYEKGARRRSVALLFCCRPGGAGDHHGLEHQLSLRAGPVF
jgi:UDP-N-acetylmuramoylalanine--D-glutamate ligase